MVGFGGRVAFVGGCLWVPGASARAHVAWAALVGRWVLAVQVELTARA